MLGLACLLGLVSQSAKRRALPEPGGCTAPVPTSPGAYDEMVVDFTVTTAAKTAAHPQFGVGNPNGFCVNGVPGMELNLVRGTTYEFLISTGGHPFAFSSTINGANAANSYPATNGIVGTPSGGGTVFFTPNASYPNLMYYVCNAHLNMGWKINLTDPVILVGVKAFLEGAYNAGSPPMRDDLRTGGLIPAGEPYTALGYSYTGTSGGTVAPAVLAVTGNNAIVDWVVLELRSNVMPSVIQASRSALIQRDGDVVATDGVSPVQFSVAAGMYRVALRQRNHLGVMTLNSVALSSTVTTVDFTSVATATFGTEATKTSGSVQVLWMGDSNFSGSLQYTGSGNDRDPILVNVGSTTPNNTVGGYSGTDLNMNGSSQYTGSGNDRDPVLVNVGSTTPNNIRTQQLP